MKSSSHGVCDLAHEVRQEEHGPLQDAHHEEVATLVVARDLGAQLGHAVLELVRLDDHLAHGRVVWSATAASLDGALQSDGRNGARTQANRGRRCAASSLKRSDTATPATHAISSPGHHHRQRAPQRARDLAVAEHVLQGLRPAQPERPHAVPVPPGAHREGRGEAARVEHRLVQRARSPGAGGSGPGQALELPAPKRQLPGTGSAAGCRRRRVVGRAANRTKPYSATARTPAPSSTTPLPPRAARRSISRIRSAPSGSGPAGGTLRQALQHQPPQRRGLRGQARHLDDRRMAARADALEGVVHGPLDDLLLVPQLRTRSRSRSAPRPGWISRSAGMTSSRRRFRAKRAVLVGLVLAPGQSGRPAIGARVRAVSRCSSGRTIRSRTRRHAEQGAAAGRRHQPVEDRLDLVGGGVPGGHHVEALARPHRLGRRVARLARPRPRGCRSRATCTRSTCSRTPRRSHSSRAEALVLVRGGSAGRGSRAAPRPGRGRAPAPARAPGTPSRRRPRAAPAPAPGGASASLAADAPVTRSIASVDISRI